MNITATLKFITPCFCAGADPRVAEIRASSLRGELRWWFRCLGGRREEEELIFGSVAGRSTASRLQVRVENVVRSEEVYSPTHSKLEDPGSYIHFFLDQPPKDGESRLWKVPPDRNQVKKGTPRPESCIPPDSKFTVRLVTRRPIPAEFQEKLEVTAKAFLHFGSVGYRQTRGFGAWHWVEQSKKRSEIEAFTEKLREINQGFSFWFAKNNANVSKGLLNQVEVKLKQLRKPEDKNRTALPAKEKTALGFSHGKEYRQTSAVRFRPIQFETAKGDPQYTLMIFQAPDELLGASVREPKQVVPDLLR